MGQSTAERGLDISHKCIPTLWPSYPENTCLSEVRDAMFTAVLFIAAEISNQPGCSSIKKWIEKMWCVYTVESYLATHKKKRMESSMSFFSGKWMKLERSPCQVKQARSEMTNTTSSLVCRI